MARVSPQPSVSLESEHPDDVETENVKDTNATPETANGKPFVNGGQDKNPEAEVSNGKPFENGVHPDKTSEAEVKPGKEEFFSLDMQKSNLSGRTGGDQTDGSSDKDKKDKKESEEEGPAVGFFEIFRFASKLDILFMLLGSLCALCHGSAFPLMVIVFGEMVDLFVENTTEDAYNNLLEVMERYALYFVGIGCGVLVLGYGQVMFWMIASERQTHRIRNKFYSNVLRQNIGWFDTQESGQLNSRITQDITKIHDGIGDKCGNFIQWFSAFLAGFAIGFVYGWKLTLVILAISPFLAGAAFFMTKLVAMASGAELKAYARAGAVAEEVLGAIRTVVAFGGQEKECKRYEENLVEARDLGVRKGLVNGVTLGFVWLIVFGAYALGFWYGAKLTRDEADNYSIGRVMIVFFAVLVGAFSLGNAAPNIQSLGVARGAAYNIYKTIDLVPPIDSFSTEGKLLDNMQGNIEIRDVQFSYPSRPDVKILNGVNLRISRGQTVALVGASGCGKSTIVQLIQRFYDPEQGQVLIDGHDLKDINTKSLREHIGIVSQEPVLFATTIAENIRYGHLEATEEDIETAAKNANAHDFISKLPDKYQTLVGERGAQLSGGQKQRIAIARALVRDPKILLLDEATSALDTESEGIVQDALEKASHGRTTIVIAHRLSTIKTADVIAGFRDGKIAEQGTHDQLMSQNGIYKQLVSSQTHQSEDDIEVEMTLHPEKAPHHAVDNSPKKTPTKTDTKEEEKKEEEKVDSSMSRIMRLNAPEWYLIMLGCFGSIINGGLMPGFAIIFAEILGVFSEPDIEKQERDIRLYSLLFVGLGGVSFVTYFLQGYMFGRSGEYLTLRLRALSFKAILRQEIAYFDDHDNSVGALTTRLSTDASQVQGAAGARLGQALMGMCSILAGIIIAFIYSWKLTLVILCFFPFIVIGGALQMQILNGAAGKNKEALEAAGKIAVESIENVRTVASLTREDMFCKNFKGELALPYKNALKKAHVIAIAFSFSQATLFYAYAASFYFGAYLIKEGEIDYVDVFKVFSAVVFSGMSLGESSSFAPDAAKAEKSAVEIFKLLDKVPAIDTESADGEKPLDNDFTSAVTFSDVKFHYPTRPDVKVLQGLNLTVEPGQTVALVGSSGCGKSTTVQLLERFYDTEDGKVLLDNHDLKDLNVQWLRSKIGIVSQEPVLFDRTVFDNIAYGDNSREVHESEVIEAARKANIHEFITSLPEGYQTSVGEKGSQLSGGQKQRIAIARALVRNPKVLLLDEATSALDTESEKVVQEALDKARQGRTSIVIAHRLSTIHGADKICIIRHGQVTEQGSHNDLMKLQGFYYKLNMIQSKKR